MSTVIHDNGIKTVVHTSRFREDAQIDFLKRSGSIGSGEKSLRDSWAANVQKAHQVEHDRICQMARFKAYVSGPDRAREYLHFEGARPDAMDAILAAPDPQLEALKEEERQHVFSPTQEELLSQPGSPNQGLLRVDKFNVRVVSKGDRYGLDFCLTHNKDEPLVEFYDARYPHTEFGQFVSRYNFSTIWERDDAGLCLDGGEPEWSICADDMAAVRAWLAPLGGDTPRESACWLFGEELFNEELNTQAATQRPRNG
jgi:hypothetical protein